MECLRLTQITCLPPNTVTIRNFGPKFYEFGPIIFKRKLVEISEPRSPGNRGYCRVFKAFYGILRMKIQPEIRDFVFHIRLLTAGGWRT